MKLLRDKCLAAALQRQTRGDDTWMVGLDDITRRREKHLLAVLTPTRPSTVARGSASSKRRGGRRIPTIRVGSGGRNAKHFKLRKVNSNQYKQEFSF